MMVSTRGRYALRVMIDLAEHNNGKFIPLKDIAERQEISEKYLESIVKSLTKADVLEGLRGKGGGYRLTRPAEEYNVYEILKLTEGSMAPVSCLEDTARECERRGMCATLPVCGRAGKGCSGIFVGYHHSGADQAMAARR